MRRIALLALTAAACTTARPPGMTETPEMATPLPAVPDVREQTADQQVMQVLNRLAFGPRPGDVAAVRHMGVDAWMSRQLHPERIDDGTLDRFIDAHYQLLGKTAAELEQAYPQPGQILRRATAGNGRGAGGTPGANSNRRDDLSPGDSARLRASRDGIREITADVQSARVARAVTSERQLQEVMTDFWLNHFSVYDGKGARERYMLPEYEARAIRPNVLGKFRTLLGAVATSEAMLFYLDNWESQADSTRPVLARRPGRMQRVQRGGLFGGPPVEVMMPPAPRPQRKGGLNENYGRELLELHTLGVDGGYTQADVIDAARALTGWTFRPPQQGGGFQFVPFMHDAGIKTILGHHLKAGRGIEDGEELLDIVARHPATAHHIAFKLARRFVSDSPSTALVDRAAAVFTQTDGDIRATLQVIITSPEFFSRAAYRSKVKSPFEVVVSAARALGAAPDSTPRTAAMVAQLGQPIYGHQAPNGWPETGEEWMNTGAILNRINFGMAIASGRLPGASALGFLGAERLTDAPLEQQVDGVVSSLLGGDVSPQTRSVLLSGENPLASSPGETAPPGGGRSGRGKPRGPQPRGLQLVAGLALGSPEFQRR